MEFVDLDADCWWLFCGTECDGAFIGPHPSAEAAETDRSDTDCQHDHLTFRMTPRQMAAKLPRTAYGHACGFHDSRTGRPLICTPRYPSGSETFAGEMIHLMQLQLTGAIQ